MPFNKIPIYVAKKNVLFKKNKTLILLNVYLFIFYFQSKICNFLFNSNKY